jgi:hypothetical protein
MTNLFSFLFLFSHLVYASHTWYFTGIVTETRQVEFYGMAAEVSKVHSTDFDAWVIQRMDTEGPDGEVVLGSAQPGDHVRVYVTGPHVLKDRIDWSLCGDTAVCRLGYFYDDALLSLDWNVPLTPSNEFIHLGHPNPSWEQALVWNTEKLIGYDNHAPAIVNPGRVSKNTPTGSAGCRKVCKSCVRLISTFDSNDKGSISRLAEIAISRIHSDSRAGRNPKMAALSAPRTCPVRIRVARGGDCLAGNACGIFLRFVK